MALSRWICRSLFRLPVGIFFVWLAVMTVYTIKNINAGAYHDPRTGRAADEAGKQPFASAAR